MDGQQANETASSLKQPKVWGLYKKQREGKHFKKYISFIQKYSSASRKDEISRIEGRKQ